jgi:starch synthase (maltosyl-transferring)
VDGRHRVVIERVFPEIDCGRFAIKRVVGETVSVEADVFADGHDKVACQVLYWQDKEELKSSPMTPLGNDRWRGEFSAETLGRYHYTVQGWIDRFQTWRDDLEKRIAAGQDVHIELLMGTKLIEEAAAQATGDDAGVLREWARRLQDAQDKPEGAAIALEEKPLQIMQRNPVHHLVTRYEKQLTVTVEREKACFSTWYEIFPRSCSPQTGHHGTFRDCEQWLAYIASMGFDVVYLSPIHPIGRVLRKGKNNSVDPQPTNVGSPWAIGSIEGGHKSIHPELGTLEDFKRQQKSTGSRSPSISRFNVHPIIRT